MLIGHATALELDGSGRVLLPQPLREYAGLEKQVTLIGQGKKLELWDQAVWTTEREHWLAAEGDGEIPQELQSLSL